MRKTKKQLKELSKKLKFYDNNVETIIDYLSKIEKEFSLKFFYLNEEIISYRLSKLLDNYLVIKTLKNNIYLLSSDEISRIKLKYKD